jgi:4-hydroxy-tetrahydrodipicolinate synthase
MITYPTFTGTYTAMVTPFRDDRVDDAALVKLIEHQIAGGVDGVVPVGTSGESPTLSTEEHIGVIQRTVEVVNKRVHVIAGTGSNSTCEAIHLTREAERVGADGVLLVAPYYNKPSQAGVLAHFSKIADSTRLPIILYSIPGRCGIEIAVETVAALANSKPNIVAIKEAGGSAERVNQLRQAVPDSFTILSGDDSLTIPFMSLGAKGVVSVASNLLPGEVSAMVRAANEGNFAKAGLIHHKYYNLFHDLFIEPNPVPIKMALARSGFTTEDVRLPLVGMQPATRARLEKTLAALNL